MVVAVEIVVVAVAEAIEVAEIVDRVLAQAQAPEVTEVLEIEAQDPAQTLAVTEEIAEDNKYKHPLEKVGVFFA